MNILVVDNEKKIIGMIAYFLETKGINVRTVHTGIDAMEVFIQDVNFFHLVISDIRLEDMDGIRLHKEILKKNETLPFIFISGHFDQESTVQALESPAPVEFLLKPFSLDTLYSKIKKYLK